MEGERGMEEELDDEECDIKGEGGKGGSRESDE